MNHPSFIRLVAGAALAGHAALAATVSIDFERGTHPAALPGTTATTLYAEQGVLFPSHPTIEQDGTGGQMLRQGDNLFPRPDPLPDRRIRCGPLVMEIRPETGARRVRMRVLTRSLRAYGVRAYSGAAEVDAFEFYPPARTRPPVRLDTVVTLRSEPGEGPITRVVANPPDDCFDLMAIADLEIETDGPPVAFNVVRALAFEVTQGVMSRLTRVIRPDAPVQPDTRLMALPDRRLTLVRGRTTGIRFYLGSSREDAGDYPAELEATLYDTEGRHETRRFRENTVAAAGGASTGVSSAPLTPAGTGEPGLTRMLVQRRGRTDLSHDFVIPGAALERTERAVLRLLSADGLALATVETRFHGPYVMGANFLRLSGTGPAASIGTALPAEPVRSRMGEFLSALLPVADPLRLRDQGVLLIGRPVPDCWTLLATADAVAGPLGLGQSIPGVNYWGNLYVAQNTPPDCGGLGWYNRPGALTSSSVSTAAQEIGHNIGMNHVSNAHGEGAGREDWESWPYLHGGIGAVDEARGHGEGVFGLVMTRLGDGGAGGWGTWTMTPVAPCGASSVDQMFPSCTAPDGTLSHDYMSYGPGTPVPPWGIQAWTSDINYYRVTRFFQDCIALDPPHRFDSGGSSSFPDPVGVCVPAGAPAPPAPEPVAELIVLSLRLLTPGVLDELLMIRRRATGWRAPGGTGEYALVLRDSAGAVIRSVPFSAWRASGRDTTPAVVVAAPADSRIRAIEVARGQTTIFRRAASASPPSVTLLAPLPGEVWSQGVQRIAWRAADPDGDSLTVLVQYSPDAGQTWLPLALMGDDQGEITVDVRDLQPSRAALVYVSATDGVRSASARSARPFRIRPADSVWAQPVPRAHWITLGAGFAAPDHLAFAGAASLQRGRMVVSVRGVRVQRSTSSGEEYGYHDAGLLLGPVLRSGRTHVSLGTGIAWVGGERQGAGGDPVPQPSTAGLPLEAQLFVRPLGSVGIGVYGFANWNRERSFAGAAAAVQLGRFP